MSLPDGSVFAGFTVVRSLGAGGMGEVYLVQHPRLPRTDALKVLPAALSADAEYRRRFEREADAAATLWHPHIVGVHDRGECDGRLWISMDYVEGSDAGNVLRTQCPGGMPRDQVFAIVTAIADALDYAHSRGLLTASRPARISPRRWRMARHRCCRRPPRHPGRRQLGPVRPLLRPSVLCTNRIRRPRRDPG